MRSIDVRSTKEEEVVTIIKFADGVDYESVVELQLTQGEYVYLNSSGEARERDGDLAHVVLDSKQDAQNLIKALERAIELCWWDR